MSQMPEANGSDMLLDGHLPHFHPALVLATCVVFGYCVSSFSYKRQKQDRYQYAVYAFALGSAVVVGCIFRQNSQLIVMGYLPCATCLAMFVSIAGHNTYRWVRSNSSATLTCEDDEEKALLSGEEDNGGR